MSRNRYDDGALAFQVACAKPVTYTRADFTKSNLDHEVIHDLPLAYRT